MVSPSARKRHSADSDSSLSKRSAAESKTSETADVEVDADVACILRPPLADDVFVELGARLRSGHLVSFPTETVYGLGANGLDARAVLNIFEAKGRPLSDPCILHVASTVDALKLLNLDAKEKAVFQALATSCWPGPLSIVGRAQSCVPLEVTASTGFVAVRCPAHDVARQLIAAAGVPLAAPSANRFGHISPTLPEHVFEDLSHWKGLRIIDGGPCNVGIESTVLKLDLAADRVLILRKGGVTKEKLEEVLAASKAENVAAVKVEVSAKVSKDKKPTPEEDQQAQEAPGMMLRHYAPSVDTLLLKTSTVEESAVDGSAVTLPFKPSKSILIDFAGQMRSTHSLFFKTFDLCGQLDTPSSATSSVEQACARVFAVLREAEVHAESQGATSICLADFDAEKLGGIAEALYDRLFRAASGCKATLVVASADPSQARLIERG